MKYSLIVLLSLAGCSSLTNEKFDNIEAARYVDIATVSAKMHNHCESFSAITSTLPVLHHLSTSALAYSSIKPNNENVIAASKIVLGFTNEINTRYANAVPSLAYCKLKLMTIAESSITIAKSLAKKD